MALAFATLDGGTEDTSGDGTMDSVSISPTSGGMVLVTVVTTTISAYVSNPTHGVSGLSGTWTNVGEIGYASRRFISLWKGIGCTGTGSLTITSTGGTTLQDLAYVIDEATGQNAATPNDAAVADFGVDTLALSDVGTVDAGDAVYTVGGHENGFNNFREETYTALATLGSLTNVRQIRTYYDDTTPDETPSWTSDGGSNGIGAIAMVINVGAAGTYLMAARRHTFVNTVNY